MSVSRIKSLFKDSIRPIFSSIKSLRRGRDSGAAQTLAVARAWPAHRLGIFSCWKIFLRRSNPLFQTNSKKDGRSHPFCYCGEGGIRTLGAISDTQSFQDCRFNHSRTSPSAPLGKPTTRLLCLETPFRSRAHGSFSCCDHQR